MGLGFKVQGLGSPEGKTALGEPCITSPSPGRLAIAMSGARFAPPTRTPLQYKVRL